MTRPIQVFASSLALVLAPAMAQSLSIHPGGEVVVTAGRIAQLPSEALRNVTVITAAEIERAGQLTLAELLQQYGGLEIAASGGPGSPASVFIRGANAAHTLVLVDGIRLQSATVGTTAFENIPVSQIERIEIVPGPVSSLYGADAVGGVIQIFTKDRRGAPAAEASVGAGTYETGTIRGLVGGETPGGTVFTLSAAHFRSGSFNATQPQISFGRFNPDRDAYRNSSVSAKVAHRWGEAHEVGATAFAAEGRAEFDNGPGTDDRTEQKLQAHSIYARSRLAPSWQSTVRLGLSRDDSTSLDTAFPASFRTDQRQASWDNAFTLGEHARIVAGVEHLEQRIATSTPYDVTRRTIRSAFAALSADHGGHAVQASVRRDDNSQFGSPTTGSIAYGYRLSAALRLRASYGTAFHAPSFNDLYFPGFGNAALRPERSRNREVGLDAQWGGQRLSATAFDNRIRELIVFVFNPDTFELRPENVSEARIRGLELAYAARIAGTDLQARLTVQEPQARPSGAQLQRRAKRHGSLVASRALGGWRLGAEMVAAGERFESADESPASRMAGYAVFNLTASRKLARDWSVHVRWNNVADRDYELVQGFRTPGSNALVTLAWAPSR